MRGAAKNKGSRPEQNIAKLTFMEQPAADIIIVVWGGEGWRPNSKPLTQQGVDCQPFKSTTS